MRITSFDSQIGLLEAQLQDMRAALIGGDPVAIQSTSALLHRLAVELVRIAQEVGRDQMKSPAYLRKISLLASVMGTLRENLVRQSAYVERALEVLVPATRQKSTYASSGLYSSPIRQSGEFTAFAA